MNKKQLFCINHPEIPAKTKNRCSSCYMKYLYRKNPGMRKKARERTNQWRKNNPERAIRQEREKHLRRNFNIGIVDYEILQTAQNNLCAICKNPETTSSRGNKVNYLAVDHCHETGTIRGLLCFKCNTAISIIEKTPSIIDCIREYLKL